MQHVLAAWMTNSKSRMIIKEEMETYNKSTMMYNKARVIDNREMPAQCEAMAVAGK